MYLRTLHVQNVKLLRDVKIDFTNADGSPRKWTVLVGENGLCKTTLLQALAVAAAGSDRATALAADVIPSWKDARRARAPRMLHITADFELGPSAHRSGRYPDRPAATAPPRLRSQLQLDPFRTVFTGASDYQDDMATDDPLRDARGAGIPGWFVAAYGTDRTLPAPGRSSPITEPSIDRLRSIFGGELVGTGFIDILPQDVGEEYAATLRAIFVQDGLLPQATDLSLRGRGSIRTTQDLATAQQVGLQLGTKQTDKLTLPATWLSQGYQGAIAWIADFVGQIFLDAGRPVKASEMEGLVLIDEIDLHLHPTWQVRLIPALRKVFPRLQFIATTHSPMMLPGLEAGEIFTLTQDADGSVVAKKSDDSPALLTGTELLSRYFEITKLYPNELGEKLRRFGYLASDPYRSDDEDAEEKKLRAELAAAGIELDRKAVPRETLE